MADPTVSGSESCKVFKCHSNMKVPKILICIICENVYHEGDFNKYSKGRYVSEMLVICPNHKSDILTYKNNVDLNTLDDNAREIIAQIKLHHKEELRSELCNNLSFNSSKNNHDTTDTNELDELSMLKMENELLKELNAELKDKNKLLNGIVNKANNIVNDVSYASVTKDGPSKQDRVLNIYVKPKNNQDKSQTLAKVKSKLSSDLAIPINRVKENKDGLVEIKCKNNVDVSRTRSVLSDKLGNDFSVELEHLKLPKIKVINVDTDMSKEELCEDIYNRNFLEIDGAFNIIADYKGRNNYRTLILEVTADSYLHLKNNGFRLYIGHQCCKIYDFFNLNLCYKCGRTNHKHRNCNNDDICLICAGNHSTKMCNSKTKKCPNCVFYNEKFKKDRATDHCATELCCEYLKFKLIKIIDEIDYPIKPILPNSIGKVENKFIRPNQ